MERLDCKVDEVVNGEEALEVFSMSRFDLVFMDIQMPGMGGHEAAKRLRFREVSERVKSDVDERVLIYGLTVDQSDEEVRFCQESGMEGRLLKPVSMDDLQNLLRTHFTQDEAS